MIAPLDSENNFKLKSKFHTQHQANNKTVKQFLTKVEEEIISDVLNREQQPGDNITRAERLALHKLAENTDIIINKADKGSTIVVQNKADYVKEGLKHLCDKTVDRKLTKNTTTETKEQIQKLLTNLENSKLLPWQMTSFCKPPPKHRTAQLYFLKKIHKNPMGIRPIVSSVNSITENISKFLDYWLQPIVRTLPSFLKDSNTFADIIKHRVQNPRRVTKP